MKNKFYLFAVILLSLNICLDAVFAEEISRLKAAGIDVSLEDVGSQQYRLVLERPGASSKLNAEVFAIENPTRLVVDVASFTAKKGQVLKVTSADVSKLRVGVHPSKLRLVIDSSSSRVPTFLVSKKGDALVVDFSFSALTADELIARASEPEKPEILTGEFIEEKPAAGENPGDIAAVGENPSDDEPDPFAFLNKMTGESGKKDPGEEKIPEIEVKNQAEEPDKQLKKPKGPQVVNWETMTGKSYEEPKKPREKVDEPLVKVTKTQAESGEDGEVVDSKPQADPRLRELMFKRVDNGAGAALVLNVDGLGEYTLSRSDASSYLLRVRGVKLAGKHLELPHFPPDFVSGIEVVVVEEKGPDVLVEIFLEDGVRLRPYRKGGNLWVRVLN